MDMTKNNDIKSMLHASGVSEARVGYQLGKHRTTINGWLALPLSNKHYQLLIKAIKQIRGDNNHD